MRYHRDSFPEQGDLTMVRITENNKDGAFIRVDMLEYDNIEGNIFYSNISKKLKAINKFVASRKQKPFPCTVHEIDSGIPTLVPVRESSEWELAENRYMLFSKMADLADDFAFANASSDKDTGIVISTEDICNNFLWNLVDEYMSKDAVDTDSYAIFLEKPDDLLQYFSFDENVNVKLLEQFTDRIECSDVVYVADLHMMVLANNGLGHLNDLIQIVHGHCKTIHYHGSPMYKLSFQHTSEAECTGKMNTMIENLKKHCTENDIKNIIKIVPNSNKVQSRTIRLTSLNKYT